jgi:hypothetical protein
VAIGNDAGASGVAIHDSETAGVRVGGLDSFLDCCQILLVGHSVVAASGAATTVDGFDSYAVVVGLTGTPDRPDPLPGSRSVWTVW